MSNKVSIIIVTTAKEDYIKHCLDSVRLQAYPDKEIIIVDNSCGRLAQHGIKDTAGLKIYPGAKDMSYCRSLNKGIEISRGDFILCLNDDTVLESRFIDEALQGFSLSPKIGMVSGKILRFDKKTLDSTGLFLTVFRAPRERGYGKSDSAKFTKAGYVFGVSGAVAFYRRKMLDELKIGSEYFDDDFGFFYEDLDIAWRGQNSGWKAYYIPAAIAYHLRGGTARSYAGRGSNKFARRYLNDELYFSLLKNRYLAIIKNDSLPGFLLNFIFIVLYDIASWGMVILFRPQLIKKIFSERIPFMSAFRKRKR